MYKSLPLIVLALITLGGCSRKTTSSGVCTTSYFPSTSFPNVGTASATPNVLALTVGPGIAETGSPPLPNIITTSVTICSPVQPTNCQTIDHILVDTGSYGLRIFNSLISVSLSPVMQGSTTLAECVQFGDGSSEWGAVEYAYVKLGGEPAVAMPIQVIQSDYGVPPGPCTDAQSYPDTSPAEAGFNGIIGVGLVAQDCGNDCTTDANSGTYYTCTGTDCGCGATVALLAQVVNPVAKIPVDNNGVVLTLPAVAAAGSGPVSGSLYLGIGTASNNIPVGTTTYFTDNNLEMSTLFSAYSATAMASFLDSGSNILFFPAPTSGVLTDCGGDLTGYFCPAMLQSLSATNTSKHGGGMGTVSFQIGNASIYLNGGNSVFPALGYNSSLNQTVSTQAFFDFGLPFFFGRTVYVGINSTASTLGTGPYWAY